MHESMECANCTHIDAQLQRANGTIAKLLKRVNELKRVAQENDCERCELCTEMLDENDVAKHVCEHESVGRETVKWEIPDDIMEANTATDMPEFSLKYQCEPSLLSSEQSAPANCPDARPNSIESTSATPTRAHIQKCYDPKLCVFSIMSYISSRVANISYFCT